MGDLSETKHGQLYASIVTTYSLAAVTVLLRFVSRRLKRCPLWWDDWLILVALVWRHIRFTFAGRGLT